MKVLLVIGVVLAAVLLIPLVVGLLLPADHTATRSARIDAPPDRVFALITEPGEYPRWRKDVKSVAVEQADPLRFRETSKFGEVLFEEVRRDPPGELVIRIADETLPYGGTWTYRLAEQEGGTELTITEDGFVRNPYFRFMSRFIFGHTATIDAYLEAARSAF